MPKVGAVLVVGSKLSTGEPEPRFWSGQESFKGRVLHR